MLVDFFVENFGPFRDRAMLSLLGTWNKDGSDNIRNDAISGEILPSAVVFGPNASGKSFIIKAFSALQAMVSAPMPSECRFPWYVPFRLSEETADRPVSLGMRMIIQGVLYCYEISFDSRSVVRESLHYYPNGHKCIVFTREGQEFRFGRSVAKGQRPMSALTNPSSSYLAVASRLNNVYCQAVRKEITENIHVVSGDERRLINEGISMMHDNPRLGNTALRILNILDFGIEGVDSNARGGGSFRDATLLPPSAEAARFWREGPDDSGIVLRHSFGEADNRSGLGITLDQESAGTRQILSYLGPVTDALLYGRTVVIDEFCSNLHPLVGRWLITQFKASRNPNGAQLVACTDDHSLMDLDTLLGKDQVYFTHRDMSTGASEIYSVFDYDEGWIGTDLSVRLPSLYQPMPYISDERLLRCGRARTNYSQQRISAAVSSWLLRIPFSSDRRSWSTTNGSRRASL